MIELFGLKLSYELLVFFGLFAASEVVAVLPIAENSVVQLVLKAVNALKPLRSEDEVVAGLKAKAEALLGEVNKLGK